jgi:aminoglycoside phosphotransferase (APT) family kinase protein
MNSDRLVVEAVFPDRTVESTSVSTIGNSKRTVAVWFENSDPVVVQCSTENSLRTEGELARAIRNRTNVPVPEVLGIGTHGGTSYVISERASGENLHGRFAGLDRPIQERITRVFGRHLAELHEAFSFEGFGGIACTSTDDGTAFRASGAADFGTWFRHYAREGIEALPSDFDRLREELHRATESIPDPASGDSVLYPWDLRPGNALIQDDDLSAVLDWGDPLAAPPGVAVTKSEYLTTDWYVADADPLRAAFREGYESVRPYPEVPSIYRLVAVLRSAVDSNGVVTRPRYPEWTGERAVEFHRSRLRKLLPVSTPA